MIAVGIGCRKAANMEDVLAAIDAACRLFSVDHAGVDVVATAALKQGERGIIDAAGRLGMPLQIIADMELREAGSRTISRSEKALALTGVGSVSEAAALAAAGPDAVLLGPRVATGPVTCAIAVSGDGK